MDTNRLVQIRKAWRGSSSRFYSPALWMSDEELETVAARIKSCSVTAIHRAVVLAEAGSELLVRSAAKATLEHNGSTESQTETTQVEGNGATSRTLKIEAIGDFAYHKVIPRIRLNGQWLEKAGFKPGHRVAIYIAKAGEMTLQFKEQLPILAFEKKDRG